MYKVVYTCRPTSFHLLCIGCEVKCQTLCSSCTSGQQCKHLRYYMVTTCACLVIVGCALCCGPSLYLPLGRSEAAAVRCVYALNGECFVAKHGKAAASCEWRAGGIAEFSSPAFPPFVYFHLLLLNYTPEKGYLKSCFFKGTLKVNRKHCQIVSADRSP